MDLPEELKRLHCYTEHATIDQHNLLKGAHLNDYWRT